MSAVKRKPLPFVVALPIPTMDREGQLLAKRRRDEAISRTLRRFDELFGGAKVMNSPATYRTLSGRTLVEEGEPLVLSMTTRATYLQHQQVVEELAGEVGKSLNQESMAVIAFASEGVLLFLS